ncbi:hypothetical protein O0L34_g15854 [Tuta absoluta]|nr:hypothetical protein O0L34_g15854 [Tuta absoluta]
MSSFLCFLCHSTVNADTNEEIREKYREVVGMHLCMDSHLCYICCHVLNKLWLFRAVCLKRSLEYPVLFSEKGTLNLQRNDLEIHSICSDDACGQYHNRNMHSKLFQMSYDDVNTTQSQEDAQNQYADVENRYTQFEDDQTEFDDYFHQVNEEPIIEPIENMGEEKYEYLDHAIEYHVKEVDSNYNFNTEYANDDQNDEIDYPDESFNDSPEEYNVDGEISVPITDNVVPNETVTDVENTEEIAPKEVAKKKKSKKSKKNGYEKIILSLEEQKAELDKRRKEKQYLESEFKCYNCAQGFLFKDTYQAHMMRHEESNGEYRCEICTLRFASPAVLRTHNANHAEVYACAACDTRVCKRARHTHARRCAGERGEGVACHLCGGVFQDDAGLQQHLKRFHKSKTSNRTYPCGVCGKTLATRAAVRTHMIKHINRKFECNECASTFGSPYSLAQHKKRKHDGDVPGELYYCEICNLGYGSRKSLTAHKRNTLGHQSVFECPICSRISPNPRSLASHIEAIHSGSKNYVCPVCAARYSNRKSLVRHIGGHQGKSDAKTVVCHLCGASFKGNSKLNRHLREVCEKAKLEEEFATLYEQGCLNPG